MSFVCFVVLPQMIVPGPLRILDLTLDSAAENVALDDVLLRATDEQDAPPLLRLWELTEYAVVVGRANRIERNVNLAACRADGVPIIRRSSGGGTVLLGPGSLVYSLVLRVNSGSRLVDIDGTTRIIMERIQSAVAGLLAGVEREGVSDLAIDAIKFSGNSQRWLRRAMLHHGTLLYNFDLDRMERYLGTPERVPDYRHGRDHRTFLRNIPVPRDVLTGALTKEWDARLPMPRPDLMPVRDAVRERYGCAEWTFKR